MAKNNSKNSYPIIGLVNVLMGVAWLIASGGLTLGSVNFQNWWAFGGLFAVYYLIQGAMAAREEGRSTIGYVSGTIGALGVMFIFLGLLSWSAIAPITIIGVGIGFLFDSRS